MNELENAMTVREFSRRTGFPEQTTRRWIRSKKLVTIKVGGRYCEQPRKFAGVRARKIAEGERLRMIKSSG